jgi:AmmeMemoRadiSam system protein A
MEVMKGLGAGEIRLLRSANSGDVSNDKSRVVGYAAVGFFGERRDMLLNRAEQKRLLQIARASVEGVVKNGRTPQFKESSKMLNEELGAFVTLRENGELRGCIGRFTPTDIPLYQVVSNMAVSAATEDMRFTPVTTGELPKIKYEISVLSRLKPAADWQKIRLGRDGVKLVKDGRGGVFLPQVAAETGWGLDEFLGQLCSQKAGLPRECYKDPAAKIFTFTAQVFEEE